MKRLKYRWNVLFSRRCPWKYEKSCPNTYVHAVEIHGL